MGALLNLWNSEKGLVGVLLLIGATVLTAIGKMTVHEWTEYTLVVFGIYVGGKTVQGVATTVVEAKARAATIDAQGLEGLQVTTTSSDGEKTVMTVDKKPEGDAP